ncbi:MAG: BBP7 family outer membrane beta-barrel protein [Pirellulales bacterium]|nr:BBP7 family outer membrane beta-barrel protein [Pirellulales bacterium]
MTISRTSIITSVLLLLGFCVSSVLTQEPANPVVTLSPPTEQSSQTQTITQSNDSGTIIIEETTPPQTAPLEDALVDDTFQAPVQESPAADEDSFQLQAQDPDSLPKLEETPQLTAPQQPTAQLQTEKGSGSSPEITQQTETTPQSDLKEINEDTQLQEVQPNSEPQLQPAHQPDTSDPVELEYIPGHMKQRNRLLQRGNRFNDIDLDHYEKQIELSSGFEEFAGDHFGRWARVEFMFGWMRGQRVPPLVTTSSAGTALENAGVLGLSSTDILAGNERFSNDARPGGRVDFGWWLQNRDAAVGARFYAIDEATTGLSFDDASGILARPFFDSILGSQQSLSVSFPGSDSGSVSVDSMTRLIGTDVYFRRPWRSHGTAVVDFVYGYQISRMDQGLAINSTTTNLDGRNGIAIGTQLDVHDSVKRKNEFHGGMLGIMSNIEGGCWTFSILAKVGLGNTRQTAILEGQSVITDPGGGTSTAAGLLVQDSNAGVFERDQFTAVPEFDFRYTRHINDCVDFNVGYTFIYWSKMIQAGEQLNLNIDPAGGTQPPMNMTSDHFWLHSLNLGMTWRF